MSAAPALTDGTVLFGTVQGVAYAVDARAGVERWRYSTRGRIQAAPDVFGDLVYFGSDDGSVYALEKLTGRLIWRQDLGAEVRAPITATEGTVYAATQDGVVYAMNSRDSRIRWRYRAGSPVLGRPVLLQGRVLVATYEGDLVSLRASNGKRVWRTADVATSRDGSPVLEGQQVLVGGSEGRLASVDARTGQVRWRARVGTGMVTSPAISGDRVLTVAADRRRGRVTALNTRTGKVVWSRPLPASSASSPAVVGNVLYVGAKDGFLYALDVRRGNRLWRFRTGREIASSPVVADGRVYVGSWDGYFYAIGTPQVGPGRVNRVRDELHRDPRGDQVDRKRRFSDIVAAGAQYGKFRAVPGVLLELKLATRPPRRNTKQVAYVWAIDNTLDAQIDYYVFVDLPPGAREYRATLERNGRDGLTTINDRLPYLVGDDGVRVFVPFAPHLSSDGSPPTLEWYAYTYYDRLPAQDEVSDEGRYFILAPRE